MNICISTGCVALAVSGGVLCAVHRSTIRREFGDAAVHCYACGELIRIGARWLVRAEGAFHLRAACLNADPASHAVKVRAVA